ncbi:hypothetical protein LUZ60_017434 [Juncus effusus]|nr:hypothetical protein LUZ60_017434 [Juncus effusus]
MIRNNFVISKAFCITRASICTASRNWHRNPNVPKWKKPEKGIIKLNFDGASKTNTKKASIGGVYRNHEGVFLLGYSEHIGKATSSVAELVAAKRGLEIAVKNGFLDVWIEGDAKFVVDMLNKPGKIRTKDHLMHVEEIRVLISMLNCFNASHIYRKGNKVADKLSKIGYTTKKPKLWRNVPPTEIERFLCEDAKEDK